MNRLTKYLWVGAAVLMPFAMQAQETLTAPSLTNIAAGARDLFYGSAAVGVAIIIYKLGKKALTKGL